MTSEQIEALEHFIRAVVSEEIGCKANVPSARERLEREFPGDQAAVNRSLLNYAKIVAGSITNGWLTRDRGEAYATTDKLVKETERDV